jgi:hypothetical protein
LSDTAIIIFCYDRPQFAKPLIREVVSLSDLEIFVSLDYPTSDKSDRNNTDIKNFVLSLYENHKVNLINYEHHLGIENHIFSTVSELFKKYKKLIIIEEDSFPSKDAIKFLERCLNKFELEPSIFHISAYTCVPDHLINSSSSIARLSKYPSSYMWATWENRWVKYDRHFINKVETKLNIGNGLISNLIWHLNFYLAKNRIIDSWATRWVASIWQNRGFCVSPNQNLVNYLGNANGTHTLMKPRYVELPTQSIDLERLGDLSINPDAECWTSKNVYRADFSGIVIRLLADVFKIAKFKLFNF